MKIFTFECVDGFSVDTGERKLEHDSSFISEDVSGKSTDDVLVLVASRVLLPTVSAELSLEKGSEATALSESSEGCGVC